VFLESAVPLAKSLHREIVSLGRRLEHAAIVQEDSHLGNDIGETKRRQSELKMIISDIKSLLERIDSDIPSLQLAITASGESLSASLPPGVSPSRLLQASTFMIIGDTQYANDSRPVQIGPAFTLSLYMLFLGHATHSQETESAALEAPPATPGSSRNYGPRDDGSYGFGAGERKPLWQEVMHKARVRLCRTPRNYRFDGSQGYQPKTLEECSEENPSCVKRPELISNRRQDEFAYHLEMVEDLDDGRVHDENDESPRPYDDMAWAGIRESIPIHQISKIFYADTGRILNVGNATEGDNNPVLLLKRDTKAVPPTKMMEFLIDAGEANLLKSYEDNASETDGSDEQLDVDRQLRDESQAQETSNTSSETVDHELLNHNPDWKFPQHLDPEWMALEVFEEDDDEAGDSDEGDLGLDETEPSTPARKPRVLRERSSMDSKLIAQIKNISLWSSPAQKSSSQPVSRPLSGDAPEASFVARSPFGAITTSLSLLEMLIRLTSLQEFQQASHLSIPDHILTFFLEETSTTGLRGAERWNVRNEAKRRVGFDPYTDTPTR
jgi:hypothetical protein